MVETCGENMGVRSFFYVYDFVTLVMYQNQIAIKNGRREAPDGADSGFYERSIHTAFF